MTFVVSSKRQDLVQLMLHCFAAPQSMLRVTFNFNGSAPPVMPGIERGGGAVVPDIEISDATAFNCSL